MKGIFDGLVQIFLQERHAGQVVEKLLVKNKKWGSRDRAIVASTIYDIVRWKRLIQEISEISSIDEKTLWLLIGSWLVIAGQPLPEGEVFKNFSPDRILQAQKNNHFSRAIQASIPDWFDQFGKEEFGSDWEKELKALNREASIVLRANTLKIDTSRLQHILKEEGIETIPIKSHPDALVLKIRRNVQTTKAFQKGLFEIQDASSQRVAPFLGIQPGMNIVDVCAGAGGKTLHLAALSQNKGRITALDLSNSKLQELKKRARRSGARHIITRHIETAQDILDLHHTADRLLIDAPCSGSGVLRRKPDMKWKSNLKLLQILRTQQAILLKSYAPILKPGGRMVYATCSIWSSENERQVEVFLANHTGYRLLDQEIISPAQSGFDGFFISLLERLV